MKLLIFFAITLLFSFNSYSIPETELENGLPQKLVDFRSKAETGSFKANDDTRIAYILYKQCANNKPIVLLPGLSEVYTQWTEMVYDLCQAGYGPVFQMDLRGQGFSDRPKELVHKRYSHITEFQFYINDFRIFLNEVVQPELIKNPNTENIYLIAHSSGGLIAGHYLTNHHGIFDKAFLIAPFFGINVPGGNMVAKLWLSFKGLWEDKTAPASAFQLHDEFDPTNRLTHSKNRWQIHKDLRPSEIRYTHITRGWVLEAIDASTHVMANAASISTPIRIATAEEDTVVSNKPIRELLRKSKKVSVEKIKGARHGLHVESDEYRDQIMKSLKEFLSN